MDRISLMLAGDFPSHVPITNAALADHGDVPFSASGRSYF